MIISLNHALSIGLHVRGVRPAVRPRAVGPRSLAAYPLGVGRFTSVFTRQAELSAPVNEIHQGAQ